ncbi:MAG: hypothetical protein PHX78_05015 [bacterium]|nr:hypothetical protein [bacterium]
MKKISVFFAIIMLSAFSGCDLNNLSQNTSPDTTQKFVQDTTRYITQDTTNYTQQDTTKYTIQDTTQQQQFNIVLPYFNDFENGSLNGLETFFNEWVILKDSDNNNVIVPYYADDNSDLYLAADLKTNFTIEFRFNRRMSPCWMAFDFSQYKRVGMNLNNWLLVNDNGLIFGRRSESPFGFVNYMTNINPNKWYTLKIQVINANRYVISFDGIQVIDYTDVSINTTLGYNLIKFEGNPLDGYYYLDNIKVSNP